MIEPLDKQAFMKQMSASEQTDKTYSDDAAVDFYHWMYDDQDGLTQVCAFPVPTEDKTKTEMGEGKWIHARSCDEFREFCKTHSDLWQYHVYSGVNTLSENPRYGRGTVEHIDTIKKLSFDIELAKDSYNGSTKEEVWWTYQYALAEVKYISEEYGVFPMVVMSENGIHLHYNVQFECTDDLLYNKQHLYSKYITQEAMNSEYTAIIESKAPDHIVFSQDDVSDPARVMKVPGTKGIKSQNGRMCGIVHKPNREEAGVITENDIDITPEELKDRFGKASNSSSSSPSNSTDLKTVDTTPSDLSAEEAEMVEHLVKVDSSFSQFWRGDVDKYDSRSEMEFGFIIKMLNHGFTESQVVNVMWASGMSKWEEESNHYRKKTLENAVEYFDGNITKNSKNGSFSFSEK